jgi:hypothetical protein
MTLAERGTQAARVLVINGPRQSGKTAVLGLLRGQLGGTYGSLDRAVDLRSARTDPTGFVTGFEEPIFIDELQRGGDPLVLAIKYEADRTNRRGRFVLAGSTRFLTEPRLSESLAGRVHFVDLWPFSQGEIDGTTDGFVDAIFADASRVGRQEPPELSRKDVFKRVCRGGFPEAVLAANGDARRNFFANYARTITAKDVQELADLEHSASLRTIINLLAARTATELNIADLARELALPAPTIRRYLPLFETIYAHHVIPAWSRNLSARVVHRPKIHMVDTGLAAYLLGVDAAGLSRPTATHAGQLLESPGLRTLQRRLGDQFVAGVVHCSDRPRPFGPGLWSLPVSSLWTAASK